MVEQLSLPRLSQRNDVETFEPNTIRSSNWRRTSKRSVPSLVDRPTETSTPGLRRIFQLAPSTARLLFPASLPRPASVREIDVVTRDRMDPSRRLPLPSKSLSRFSTRNRNFPSPNESILLHGIPSFSLERRMLSA